MAIDDVTVEEGVLPIASPSASTKFYVSEMDASIKVYPNPVEKASQVNLGFTGFKDLSTQIDILDSQGRLIESIVYLPSSNQDYYSLSILDLTQGLYFVTVKNERGRFIEKIIVK